MSTSTAMRALRRHYEKSNYADVVDLLESTPGGDGLITQQIAKHFQRPVQTTTNLYHQLVKLPIDHFATTNYDPWLKNALAARTGLAPRVYTPHDVGAFADLGQETPPLVLMLHGDADRPATCVLSGRSYRRLTHDRAYRSALLSLVTARHLLIIGHSLTDPDLRVVLDEYQEVFRSGGGQTQRHWFLGARIDPVERQQLSLRGIEPIEYVNHAEIPDILTYLSVPKGSALHFPVESLRPEPGPPNHLVFLSVRDYEAAATRIRGSQIPNDVVRINGLYGDEDLLLEVTDHAEASLPDRVDKLVESFNLGDMMRSASSGPASVTMGVGSSPDR